MEFENGGEIRSIIVEAPTKLDAKELFRKRVNRYCETIKLQTNEEVAKEIADSIFKNVKNDLAS